MERDVSKTEIVQRFDFREPNSASNKQVVLDLLVAMGVSEDVAAEAVAKLIVISSPQEYNILMERAINSRLNRFQQLYAHLLYLFIEGGIGTVDLNGTTYYLISVVGYKRGKANTLGHEVRHLADALLGIHSLDESDHNGARKVIRELLMLADILGCLGCISLTEAVKRPDLANAASVLTFLVANLFIYTATRYESSEDEVSASNWMKRS